MIRIKFSNETDYRSVAFTRVNEHVVTLKGDTEIVRASNTSGFYTYKTTSDVLLGDFTDYTTVYRVTDEFIQYSNDGSKWEAPPEPVRDVYLSVQWDDANDADGIRPEYVTVAINDAEEITLTAENSWCTVIPGVPISKDITITSAEELEDYVLTFCGQSVVYYHEYIDPAPSLEERVTDTEDAIIELYDLVLTTLGKE